MHPTLTQVLTSLEQSRERLRTAIETIPGELRDQPPGSDRWSVAAVLEHLALVAERAAGVVGRKVAEARTANAGPEETSPAVLTPQAETMLIDRSSKREAPEAVRPAGLTYAAALARLDAGRTALKTTLVSADGLALGKLVHEHPRFGPLNPYQWAGFVAAHELRHAAQIAEIASQLDVSRRSPEGAPADARAPRAAEAAMKP